MTTTETEQCPGDYTLTPCGRLGALTGVGVVDEKFLGEYETTEAALAMIRERMESEQFWPSVWWVSDHGNYWPIDLDGHEIKAGD